MDERKAIKNTFLRGLHTYEQHALVQKEVAIYLASLIQSKVHISPRRILELGSGTGFLTRRLVELFPNAQYYLNDLNEETRVFFDSLFEKANEAQFLFGDAEEIAFPEGIDLLVSSSTFQWLQSHRTFFEKMYHCLPRHAYLSFSSFGEKNFSQIKGLTGRGLPYLTIKETRELLVNIGFSIVYEEEVQYPLFFPSVLDLLKHLKYTGVNGYFSQKWTPDRLNSFIAVYEKRYRTEKGIPLSYHPLYMIAKK